YTTLADLRKHAGDFAGAVRGYEQARAVLRQLVQKDPGHVDYRSWLGGTLNNLSFVLEKMGRLQDALTVIDQAITHQRVAYTKAPHVQQYRQFLGNHYLNRA